MANVVFILGAGTSAQGGAPLMANFLDAGIRSAIPAIGKSGAKPAIGAITE
jgi:hypothetical protein